MAVRRRERRQERECLAAAVAEAAANPDPIMVFIMRLLAAAAVTDDGVLGTNGASAQDDSRARLSPIGFEVVLGRRKWDKQNRSNEGFARLDTWEDLSAKTRSPSLLNKSHLEKNNASLS